MIGMGRGQDEDVVAGQRSLAGAEALEAIAKVSLWEGVRGSGGLQWPLQGSVGRATSWLKCKLLTHSCSKSSGGTVGQLAAGNLIRKSPIGAGFTALKLLLRYLHACGKNTDCFLRKK